MSFRKVLLSATSLGLLASCDPRVFDDLADSTWVTSAGKPGDLKSAGYGVGLVGVSDGSGDLRYVVAAQQPAATVWAKFDKAGSRSINVGDINGTQPGTEALTASAVMASDVTGTAGNIAIATFVEAPVSEPSLFMINSEDGGAAAPISLVGNTAPTGIAFGTTDLAGGIDLLAVAGEDLNLIADYRSGSAAGSCALGAVGGDIMVADVDPAAESEVLIAFGGSVSVTTGSALQTAIAVPEACFATALPVAEITAPGSEASFGTALRHGDFDGDGNTDIVISAPAENAVYVFMNWTVAAPTTGTKIPTPSGAVEFGRNVAVGDFNDDGKDELVISDHGADADGESGAGTVYIYSDGFGTPIELYDASPEADQKFGQSLAVAKAFGGDSLIVGADDEIFTYFRTPVSGDGDSRE